jgi:hypothetical protein
MLALRLAAHGPGREPLLLLSRLVMFRGRVAGGDWVESEPGCRDVAAAICR